MDEQASFEPKAVLAGRRAGWNRLVAIVPALALAATAVLGLSGQSFGAGTANRSVAPAAAPASGVTGIRLPVSQPEPATDPDYPHGVLGLEVRSVATVMDASPPLDGPVAVSGWYVSNLAFSCPQPDVGKPVVTDLGVDANANTFCQRWGRLFRASPQRSTEGAASYLDENRFKDTALPALTVTMTPGVVAPAPLDDAGAPATPVVLIGRMVGETGVDCYGPGGCPPSFRVDRVIWSAGLAQARTSSILPSLLDAAPPPNGGPPYEATESTVGPEGPILMETLVDQRTLRAVDPTAASMVAEAAPKAERLWYRLTLADDPADAPSWVVIDDATGTVVAASVPAFLRFMN